MTCNAGGVFRRAAGDAEYADEARGPDLARRRKALGAGPPAPAHRRAERPGAFALASTTGVAAARAAVPEVDWTNLRTSRQPLNVQAWPLIAPWESRDLHRGATDAVEEPCVAIAPAVPRPGAATVAGQQRQGCGSRAHNRRDHPRGQRSRAL